MSRKRLCVVISFQICESARVKILVTAGPTREAVDPVRFISNRSTGKMGYAVVFAAVARGHEVRLVTGPVSLDPPESVETVGVESAAEMLAAVRERVAWCDCLVMCAAVADWRPKVVSDRKLKKKDMSPVLELERTEDILASILPVKGERLFVGFAAETNDVAVEARRKLREKEIDLIVANDVSRDDAGFGVDTNVVSLYAADGFSEDLPLMSKRDVAGHILDWIERQGR